MKDHEQVRTYIRKDGKDGFRAEFRIAGPSTAKGKGRLIALVPFKSTENGIEFGEIVSDKYAAFIDVILTRVKPNFGLNISENGEMSMLAYTFKQIGVGLNALENRDRK